MGGSFVDPSARYPDVAGLILSLQHSVMEVDHEIFYIVILSVLASAYSRRTVIGFWQYLDVAGSTPSLPDLHTGILVKNSGIPVKDTY